MKDMNDFIVNLNKISKENIFSLLLDKLKQEKLENKTKIITELEINEIGQIKFPDLVVLLHEIDIPYNKTNSILFLRIFQFCLIQVIKILRKEMQKKGN